MLYSMDLMVLNLAIPQLSLELKPSASELLWIVDIYGFFLAGALITMGTLGDRIGRRKILLIGSGVFAITSAIAAFSKSAEMLIFMRAVQGIAGATLAPSTLSLIRVLFRNPKQRAQAVGLWGTSFSIGGLIGPLVGGALIEHFWWGSVFLINVPFMIVLLLIAPKLLPEFKDENGGEIDLISAALSLTAILLIIFSLKKFAETGFQSLSVISLLAGLVLGAIFIRRQEHLEHPLVDVNLFKNFTFNTLILTNALTMSIFFGTFLFQTQYMQLVLGFSPLVAGLWSLPSTFAMILSSSLSPLLAKKIKPAYIMSFGLFLGTVAFFIISRVNGIQDLGLMIFGTVLQSFGAPPVLLFTTNMLVNSAPPEKAGAAAAISETGNEMGGALGIAILGSIGTFIYRREMTNAVLENINPEIKKTAATTLENAIEVAKSAGTAGDNIITQAKVAYTASFSSVMLIGAVVLAVLSFLVITKLRHVQLEAEHGEQS
ncbi:MFS transporter [Bdellovibrio sp. NC01]|nr:MFS transporter [Bdellovibrio sp. NC01]